MRIFTATLGTETNTFATYPTGLEEFRDGLWSETGIENAAADPNAGPALVWLHRARALGWDVVESLHAFAPPSGTVTRHAYETMRDHILGDLRGAGRIDAVLLYLHGAMIADGYDDCEGDLVTRVRAIVGEETRIGVELDLHAHIDHALGDAADVIVFFKAYPHIDYNERAGDVFDLIERTLAGGCDPRMALFDCNVLALFPTTPEGPMKRFVADMMAAEGKNSILSLSLNHGFPWADSPIGGAKMLAIADGSDELASSAAREFGQRFRRICADAALKFTSFDAAIDLAAQPGDKPLLLADVSDQSGSGAPGDTTHMARAFIERQIPNAVFGPIWDPAAIEVAFRMGAGTRINLRIGGKSEPQSGPPLDVEVEILFVKRDAWQTQDGLEPVSIGDIAVVRHGGVEIVLTSKRVNVYAPSFFTLHGVTLADKQVIGIKNLYKHTDVFAPLVRAQHYVATPGVSQPDLALLPFRRLPRPMWPLDPLPLD